MSDIDRLLKEAVGELDRLLQARNVVGEPIVQGGVTLIPLVSFGFGFGAGGGSDASKGGGGGTGGGGGIRPVAVVVIDAQGTRVEPLRLKDSPLSEAIAAFASKLAEAAGAQEKTGRTPDAT